jgi:hypothetical protein
MLGGVESGKGGTCAGRLDRASHVGAARSCAAATGARAALIAPAALHDTRSGERRTAGIVPATMAQARA